MAVGDESHNNRNESLASKSEKLHSSFFQDFMLLLWSIGSYVFDITCDVALILEYHQNGDFWYSALTITFVAVPAIIIAILSGINYYERWTLAQKIKNKTEDGSDSDDINLRDLLIVDSSGRFIFRFLFTILLISPIFR